MSEKEKNLIRRLSDTLPKLNRENQKYVLGIVEGMAMMAKQPGEDKKDGEILVS